MAFLLASYVSLTSSKCAVSDIGPEPLRVGDPFLTSSQAWGCPHCCYCPLPRSSWVSSSLQVPLSCFISWSTPGLTHIWKSCLFLREGCLERTRKPSVWLHSRQRLRPVKSTSCGACLNPFPFTQWLCLSESQFLIFQVEVIITILSFVVCYSSGFEPANQDLVNGLLACLQWRLLGSLTAAPLGFAFPCTMLGSFSC